MKSPGAFLSVLFTFSLPLSGMAVDFHKDVLPIFEAKCFRCHGNGEDKGGLALDADQISNHIRSSRQINPGNAARSVLVELLVTTDADDRMPKNRAALSTEEIETIKTWINEGASIEMAEGEPTAEVAMQEKEGPKPLKGTWKNSQGTPLEATLIKVEDGKAHLDTGEKVYEYPIANLHPDSQKIIAEWVKSGESSEGDAAKE